MATAELHQPCTARKWKHRAMNKNWSTGGRRDDEERREEQTTGPRKHRKPVLGEGRKDQRTEEMGS